MNSESIMNQQNGMYSLRLIDNRNKLVKQVECIVGIGI